MPLQVGEQAPAPDNNAVRLREHPGGWYAAGERHPWLAQNQPWPSLPPASAQSMSMERIPLRQLLPQVLGKLQSQSWTCCVLCDTLHEGGNAVCEDLSCLPGICGGAPSDSQMQREIRFVKQEGSRPLDDSWIFARYNEAKWPKGPFRRNDVLVPLDEASIDLWRGVDWDHIKRVVAQRV
jgi:hypothetical protein